MSTKKAEEIIVLPSASRGTVSPNLNGWPSQFDECMFVVDVTVAGTSLDIAYQVQEKVSGSWVDHTALAQITGTGTYLLKVPNNIGENGRLNCVGVLNSTYSVTAIGKINGGR